MKRIITLTVMFGAAICLAACGGAATNANKPATNATNSTTSNANSANTSKSNTASNSDSKAKTEIKDEEKPKGETKKQKNAPTVPAEWVYYADEAKGYGFSLPKGSTGESTSEDGIDTFVAVTPDDITVIVYAFKDPNLSKEDLLERAEKAMEAMGEKMTAGELKAESDDYAIADASAESKDGTKSKLKVLVATDVTDNYVMFVRSDAASYDSKKATMDMIWGSFEMYSGGASGGN